VLFEAGGQVFVGPDNGVFSMVLKADAEARCFEITRRELMRPEISSTFHGRDIFAPVGAAIASGKAAPFEVGPEIFNWKQLDSLEAEQLDGHTWAGRILNVDRFGNLITNFPSSAFSFLSSEVFEIAVGDKAVTRYGVTFGEVPPGEILAYPGSSGYVEIGVNQGNAASRLHSGAGDVVTLKRTARGAQQAERLRKAL
jgi:S-adenosylmethionine hydrolase